MTYHKKDILCKSTVEDHPEEMIRFFYPDADQLFDFSKGIELLDIELPDIAPDGRFMKDSKRMDKVLKVFTLAGDVVYIIANVEFQAYHDPHFAKRIFTYFYRLLDRYDECIHVLVIYTNKRAGRCPSSFKYSRFRTRLSFDFTPYKVWEQSEEELLGNKSLYAFFILIMQLATKNRKKEERLFEKGLQLAETVAGREMDETKKHKVLNLMRLYFDFKSPELRIKFDNAIKTLIKTDTMGIFEVEKMFVRDEALEIGRNEGRNEGREEGIELGKELGDKTRQLKAARNLFRLGVDIDIIMEATELSREEIERLRQQDWNDDVDN